MPKTLPMTLTTDASVSTAYARMNAAIMPADVRQMLADGMSPVLVGELFPLQLSLYNAEGRVLDALAAAYQSDFCERLDDLVEAQALTYQELWNSLPASPLKCSYHYLYLADRLGYSRVDLSNSWQAKESLRGLTVLLPLATWRVAGARTEGSKRVGPDGLPRGQAWRVAGRAATVIEDLLAPR